MRAKHTVSFLFARWHRRIIFAAFIDDG